MKIKPFFNIATATSCAAVAFIVFCACGDNAEQTSGDTSPTPQDTRSEPRSTADTSSQDPLSTDSTTNSGSTTIQNSIQEETETRPQASVEPMGDNARAIFLFHSTGSRLWDTGMAGDMAAYNASSGKNYELTGRTFPAGMQNNPYDFWNLWVKHGGTAQYDYNDTLELLTQDYDVIVWKHCFTAAAMVPDSGNANPDQDVMSLEVYQAQYNDLKEKMRSFPSKRFLVWTPAAALAGNTTASQAGLVQKWAKWEKETWDEPGDNIYLWDFYELETEGGLYLKEENAVGEYDCHPGPAFSEKVAPMLLRRIIAVIEGRGDTESLTGK